MSDSATTSSGGNPLEVLRQQLRCRWPETAYTDPRTLDRTVFQSGLPGFDALFPLGGIPYGQLIEITGAAGSGKTAFLYALLAGLTSRGRAAYIDFCNCFFPTSAECGGLDLSRLLVVKPTGISNGLRSAELLLKHRQAIVVVFDLVTHTTELPLTILHRLRRKIARARGLVIFLTESDTRSIVPASMASLRLGITRRARASLAVEVLKSRICSPGGIAEVSLYG